MDKIVYSLFDGSGIMVRDWADAGCKCYCFNADSADHKGYSQYRIVHENITYVNLWIGLDFEDKVKELGIPEPDIIFGFPPCTNIAVSGAAHFKEKLKRNPLVQIQAVQTAKIVAFLGDYYSVPYMLENPVSVLSTMWRKPDYTFHPYEFSMYLFTEPEHPVFPEYIADMDMYPKKTCLWTGNGFNYPVKQFSTEPSGYSTQHLKLGGKSAKTKIIRSFTPRGFSKAVFCANINSI